jgi:hypothetical protein
MKPFNTSAFDFAKENSSIQLATFSTETAKLVKSEETQQPLPKRRFGNAVETCPHCGQEKKENKEAA